MKDLAINFLLYGALAEIFARTTGFNRGLGGSMHAFFIPFESCRTTRSSAARLLLRSVRLSTREAATRRGIVIANSGDGASDAAPSWNR